MSPRHEYRHHPSYRFNFYAMSGSRSEWVDILLDYCHHKRTQYSPVRSDAVGIGDINMGVHPDWMTTVVSVAQRPRPGRIVGGAEMLTRISSVKQAQSLRPVVVFHPQAARGLLRFMRVVPK